MPGNGSARRLSVFVSLKNNLVTAMIELQLVLRHMHIRRPLGKRFDKTYVVVIMTTPPLPPEPNDLGCHVVPCRCWSVFHSA